MHAPTRHAVRLAVLACALAAIARSTTPAPAQPAPTSAEVLIERERAFANAAAARGMRAAFLEHLAASAILFRPGPVLGRAWFESRPATPVRLAWRPWHAEISASGDLGWTTGPWTIQRDSTQRTIDGAGEYVTVWRREADGVWRAVIDGGISHAIEPDARVTEPSASTLPARARTGTGPLARRESLWRADADFAKAAAASTTAGAVRLHGAERLLLLREGLPRVAGLLAAHDTLAARAERPSMLSTAQFISEAGDLGYTYGSFVRDTDAGADSSWYLNVWRQGEARRWELALHLVMPGAPPRK